MTVKYVLSTHVLGTLKCSERGMLGTKYVNLTIRHVYSIRPSMMSMPCKL